MPDRSFRDLTTEEITQQIAVAEWNLENLEETSFAYWESSVYLGELLQEQDRRKKDDYE